MKKINLEDFDWKAIQEIYDQGDSLSSIGLSRKILKRAIENGFLTKRKVKLSENTKKKISESRKKWMNENPDLHPWRKKSRFASKPCENVKKILQENGIFIEEEVIVSNEKNYSVDILIPERNLILEINGNQHYQKNGKLKPYYQERHDHIKKIGWEIMEIHYSLAWNEKIILDLIENHSKKSLILDFKKKDEKNKPKYGKRKDYIEALEKIKQRESNELITKVKESDIDFSKFGWVNKVSMIIGKKPQKVNMWMKKYMQDFYETKCFKKNQKQIE